MIFQCNTLQKKANMIPQLFQLLILNTNMETFAQTSFRADLLAYAMSDIIY